MKYNHQSAIHNDKAPSLMVPYLVEIFKPSSVLDVGCGLGHWLKEFKENGVKNVFGLDGEYVAQHKLLIKESDFKRVDLEESFILPRKYDLALSLEVAEHLSINAARLFIESLTKVSDIIIFSAACPNQGGQNHLNEQKPDYWVKHFNSFSFVCYDCFRPVIWNMEGIDWWYKQNMFLAVNKSINVSSFDPCLGLTNLKRNEVRDIIHPDLYNYRVQILKEFSKKYHCKTSLLDQLKIEKFTLKSLFSIVRNMISSETVVK